MLIPFLIPNLLHVKHVKGMMRDQGPSDGENGLRGLEWDRTWGVWGLGDWDLGLTLTSIVNRFSDALRVSVFVRCCNPSLSMILPPMFT